MAQIEQAALEYEVVERLSFLLRASEGRKYSTTETLSHFTAILAWVMQRVCSKVDGPAIALKRRWEAQGAGEAPWSLPAPLAAKKLLPALIDLRNASSHAGSESSAPINRDGQLVGYQLGDARAGHPAWRVELSEDQIREIGLRVAEQFVAAMRPVGSK